MAGTALPEPVQSFEQSLDDPPAAIVRVPKDRVKETVVELYGRGYSRSQIAKMLSTHIAPNSSRPVPHANRTLRRWEKDQKFRDAIYNASVVKLDLALPSILDGVAKKAKRGRVDAARLALEVTGRHNPKGDAVPTQIAIVVNGVPRPQRAGAQDVVVEAVEASEEEA